MLDPSEIIDRINRLPGCPTCAHLHPGGIGLYVCACGDCSLLYGDVPIELLAPEYRARLEDMVTDA